MTSGGDRSEAPFELPARVRARRRKRWLVYTAAIAGATVFFLGGAFALGENDIVFPAMVLMLIPFPALWAGVHVVEELFDSTIGRTLPLAYLGHIFLFWAPVFYVFVYLFVVCLPSFYRRRVLGISWWLFQIIVLLPGIACGICYWWFFS